MPQVDTSSSFQTREGVRSKHLTSHLLFSVLDSASHPACLKEASLRVAGLLLEKRYASEPVFEPLVRARRLEQKFHEAQTFESRVQQRGQILGLLDIALAESLPLLGGYALVKKTGSIEASLLDELLRIPEPRTREEREVLFSRYFAPAMAGRAIVVSGDAVRFESSSQWFEYTHYSLGRDIPGKVTALLMVETAESLVQCGLAQNLLRAMLDYSALSGSEFAFGFARMPGLRARFPQAEEARARLQEYVSERRSTDGLHPDHYIRFHQRAGGRLICGIPFVAEDPKSHHCGAFMVYDLRKR